MLARHAAFEHITGQPFDSILFAGLIFVGGMFFALGIGNMCFREYTDIGNIIGPFVMGAMLGCGGFTGLPHHPPGGWAEYEEALERWRRDHPELK